MFHCPVGVWVIEQRAIILSATVRSHTVYKVRNCYWGVQHNIKMKPMVYSAWVYQRFLGTDLVRLIDNPRICSTHEFTISRQTSSTKSQT